MDLERRVVTAGAYVAIHGLVPFVVGPTKAGDRLGVVRPGGHREPEESGWECAAREVLEEASLHIDPLLPPATYWITSGEPARLPQKGEWPVESDAQPGFPPLLVARRPGDDGGPFSLMYLACSDETPVPAAEAQGLLLLDRADIARLTSQPVTLRYYLETGGRAIFRDTPPLDLPLEPFPQLRWLAMLLDLHPDLLT